MAKSAGIVQDETSTRPISYRPLHGRVSLSRSREVGYFQALSLWTLCFFALGPRSRRLPLRTLLFVFHGWISRFGNEESSLRLESVDLVVPRTMDAFVAHSRGQI